MKSRVQDDGAFFVGEKRSDVYDDGDGPQLQVRQSSVQEGSESRGRDKVAATRNMVWVLSSPQHEDLFSQISHSDVVRTWKSCKI